MVAQIDGDMAVCLIVCTFTTIVLLLGVFWQFWDDDEDEDEDEDEENNIGW